MKKIFLALMASCFISSGSAVATASDHPTSTAPAVAHLNELIMSYRDREAEECLAGLDSSLTFQEEFVETLEDLPQYWAAATGNVALLRRLAARGANLFVLDKDGFMLLHVAAGLAQVDATRYLLEHGLPAVLLTKNGGYSPLLLAYLLPKNPNPECADTYDASTEVMKMLVERGALDCYSAFEHPRHDQMRSEWNARARLNARLNNMIQNSPPARRKDLGIRLLLEAFRSRKQS